MGELFKNLIEPAIKPFKQVLDSLVSKLYVTTCR
jgi:hypothetical protein